MLPHTVWVSILNALAALVHEYLFIFCSFNNTTKKTASFMGVNVMQFRWIRHKSLLALFAGQFMVQWFIFDSFLLRFSLSFLCLVENNNNNKKDHSDGSECDIWVCKNFPHNCYECCLVRNGKTKTTQLEGCLHTWLPQLLMSITNVLEHIRLETSENWAAGFVGLAFLP